MLANGLEILFQLIILWSVHSVKNKSVQAQRWLIVIDVLVGLIMLATVADFWLDDWLGLHVINVILSFLMVGAVLMRLRVIRRQA
ncbi:hypothetical protein [Loigolactobacillus binensis]|uniref:Uncharacterized protein n=1 Tax=Loigolactobacillus binensis TaxID=2559922 RepID=A0ABW3E7P5_9LACO|nr:hypothetical protein [Loigolactobacillus binensis]